VVVICLGVRYRSRMWKELQKQPISSSIDFLQRENNITRVEDADLFDNGEESWHGGKRDAQEDNNHQRNGP